MRRALIVTLCLIGYSFNSTAITVDPPTLTDSHGNFANENSSIAYAPVPAGDPYVVDPSSYSYKGLLPLFKGVQGFVHACFFGDTPFETFIGLMDGSVAFGQDLILALAKWGGGFAFCLVLGLGFIFIFPIVGCCLCCCRTCCQNCGGKMEQKRTDNSASWRCCFIIVLFVSCTFLGCAMICTFVVNQRMSELFSEVATTVEENADDFVRYANNTVNQINFVAYDGFNFTSKVMLRDLDNIGPLVGGAVQASFDRKAGIDNAFNQLLALDPLLLDMINGLKAVNTRKVGVVTSVNTLEASMTQVATDITATFSTCGAPCGTAPDVSALEKGSDFDPNGMPSFDSELADLEAVYAENLTALVSQGKAEFNNITGTVEDQAAPVVNTIRDMVGTFDGVVSSALEGVNDMFKLFDTITNLTDIISDLEKTKVSGSLTVGDLENYRWMGGVGLTSFILVIMLLQLIGLTLGCIGCCCCGDKDKLPTERSAISNCGGLLLMASVGLVFIFGALIMLLVFVTFIVGAPLEQLVCLNLRDTEYTFFKELLDGGDPANGPYNTLLGEQTGYTLGKTVFGNDTVPLTVSGLLTDCDNNEPAWKALYVSKLFNLNDVLDYKGTIDIDGQIDQISVDLSSLEMLDADTKVQLTDMSQAIQDIEFEDLENSLQNNTVTVDFNSLRSSLSTAATAIQGDSSLTATYNALNDHIDELTRIENDEVAEVSTAQQDMLTSVRNLNASSVAVPAQITLLISTIETTEAELQTNGVQIVKNESKNFALRVLGIGDQFVSFVNSTIQEELGRCKPVSNFYKSVLVNTLCGSVVDSWNGVWFTLGWSLAFMVLGIILSTKLAKHFRRMKTLHPDDHANVDKYKNDDSKDYDGERISRDYAPKSGKIHPI